MDCIHTLYSSPFKRVETILQLPGDILPQQRQTAWRQCALIGRIGLRPLFHLYLSKHDDNTIYYNTSLFDCSFKLERGHFFHHCIVIILIDQSLFLLPPPPVLDSFGDELNTVEPRGKSKSFNTISISVKFKWRQGTNYFQNC